VIFSRRCGRCGASAITLLAALGFANAYGAKPNPPQFIESGTPAGALSTVVVADAGVGAGRPIAVGVPLREGSIPTGTSLVAVNSDGTVLESQWNELTQWRSDGSAMHGVLTFLTPDAGDNGSTYYILVGHGASGNAIGRPDVLGAGFDASVSVNVSGSQYSLSAKELLDGSVTPRRDYTHFTGPIAAEFVLSGPLREDGTGSAHRSLQAHFYIRAFNRPVDRVHVTTVLENTGAFEPLQDIPNTSVDVRVGGVSVPGFPKASFTVHADVRYQTRNWWNGSPSIWAQIAVEDIQDTGLVPEYREIPINSQLLEGLPQTTTWNERRILSSAALDSGGAKPELAPYDRWTATYLISGDQRAWNAMRAAQDEYAAVVSKRDSALMRPRDETTGWPIDLAVHGVVSEEWGSGGPETLLANRDTIPQAKTDLAHQPAIGYITYLLTGELNELEALHFSAISAWLNTRPGGYPGKIPNRQWGAAGQPRAIAWGFREVLNAGTVTPTAHPLRSTMEGAVTNALNEMNSRARSLDATDGTGLWLTGPGYGVAIVYGADQTPNPNDVGTGATDGVGVAIWQDDWLTWSVGVAYERGWKAELDQSGLWAWQAQSVVSRFGTSADSFCWDYAAPYAIGVQDDSGGPLYGSWQDLFAKNWPGVSGCAPVGGRMAGSSDSSATRYGAQIAPALAIAASTGITGAREAWEIYDQRDTSHWSSTYADAPEWALKPR